MSHRQAAPSVPRPGPLSPSWSDMEFAVLPVTWHITYFSPFKKMHSAQPEVPQAGLADACVQLLVSLCLSLEYLPIALVGQGLCLVPQHPGQWLKRRWGTRRYGHRVSACNLHGDHEVAPATHHLLFLSCPGCSSAGRAHGAASSLCRCPRRRRMRSPIRRTLPSSHRNLKPPGQV